MNCSVDHTVPGQRHASRWHVVATLLAMAWLPRLVVAERTGEPASPRIRLNSVGFLPGAEKAATIAAPCREFSVLARPTNECVLKGRVTGPVHNPDTDEQLYLANFTAVDQSGDYVLFVPGVGRSEPFPIDSGIYNTPFYHVVRGMYLLRCGTAVHGDHGDRTYRHAACHLEDGYLDFAEGKPDRREAVGGWHDAGDYNKYTINGAFSAGMMLQAWEHFHDRLAPLTLGLPPTDAATPEFLREVRWEIDWLLRMQADDGRVYHKLSTRDFGGFVMPEEEIEKRYFCPWSSAATADFVAVTAMGSRVFRRFDREYSQQCLDAAEKSQKFLMAHPENHAADQAAFSTGAYATDDRDDRLWALAELWETTGAEEYLQAFEAGARQFDGGRLPTASLVDADWDWMNLKNLGMFTYLRSSRPGRDPQLVARVRDELLATADGMRYTAERHAYARPLGSRYYWGCHGTVARQAMNLQLAFQLTGDEGYRATILDALGHLFGRNVYGRSLVTGIGRHPPQYPHDRRSGADRIPDPWPGYLIGGPWPTASDWQDDQKSYQTNEIAINWNAALIYALAGVINPATFAEDVSSPSVSRAVPASDE